MEYCGPLGIPHSRFAGWDRDDRDKAVVWQARKRQACPSCRTRPDEWDEKVGGSNTAYRAEIKACRGCEVVAGGQAQITKEHGNGAYVALVRGDTPHDPGEGPVDQ